MPGAMRSIVRIALGVYASLFAFAWFFSDAVIFQPRPPSYSDGPPYRKIPAPGGGFVAIRSLWNPKARFTILFSHGNAEDLGDLEPSLRAYAAHGFSVVAYDYSGYGASTGSPSEEAAYANILAVYEYLLREHGLPPERIIAFGRSVGSGPGVELAIRKPVGGLILESAFTSAFRVATILPILPFDRFENIRKISAVRCPLLFIHGRRDGIVAFRHGETLYDRAPSPKMRLWVDGAGHNDVMRTAGEAYWKALAEFERCVSSTAPERSAARSPSRADR